jgi:hypothetical protein
VTVAATDLYPRSKQERDLCEDASQADWLYLSIPPLLVAGAIVLDTQVFKYDPSVFVRELGPSFIGLTWGVFVGSFYPSMPKCSPHFTTTVPPEGQVRTSWPVALSFALLAGMTAPVLDWIVIGPIPTNGATELWPTEERVTRVVLAGTLAFGAALLPYLLPPKPLRASRKLIDLRPTVGAHSVFVSGSIRF